MTTGLERTGINAQQAALAKMGGGKRRTCKHKSCNKRCGKSCNKSCNKRRGKSCNKRRSYKHHSRKIRGGAVAPTTTGGSQTGSTKLFIAQQQAGANRQFDTPNKT